MNTNTHNQSKKHPASALFRKAAARAGALMLAVSLAGVGLAADAHSSSGSMPADSSSRQLTIRLINYWGGYYPGTYAPTTTIPTQYANAQNCYTMQQPYSYQTYGSIPYFPYGYLNQNYYANPSSATSSATFCRIVPIQSSQSPYSYQPTSQVPQQSQPTQSQQTGYYYMNGIYYTYNPATGQYVPVQGQTQQTGTGYYYINGTYYAYDSSTGQYVPVQGQTQNPTQNQSTIQNTAGQQVPVTSSTFTTSNNSQSFFNSPAASPFGTVTQTPVQTPTAPTTGSVSAGGSTGSFFGSIPVTQQTPLPASGVTTPQGTITSNTNNPNDLFYAQNYNPAGNFHGFFSTFQ